MDFYKYSGTGNDFIVLDNRSRKYSSLNSEVWTKLCHRRTGIGADGVLLLESSNDYDFKMVYLNADGDKAEMCGNGARSITHFSHFILKLKASTSYSFEVNEVAYHSKILSENSVEVEMKDIKDINQIDLSSLSNYKYCKYLNTGVPHCVFEVDDLDNLNVAMIGKKIRNNKLFENGTNVNFFEIKDEIISMRTFERGVEDETLSCGTGAVATAIAISMKYNTTGKLELITKGGTLQVRHNKDFTQAYLLGPVELVYSGQYSLLNI